MFITLLTYYHIKSHNVELYANAGLPAGGTGLVMPAIKVLSSLYWLFVCLSLFFFWLVSNVVVILLLFKEQWIWVSINSPLGLRKIPSWSGQSEWATPRLAYMLSIFLTSMLMLPLVFVAFRCLGYCFTIALLQQAPALPPPQWPPSPPPPPPR